MRKVVLAMMTTMNGRVDDPDAWMTGIGNDVYRDIDSRYEGFDTVLVGRTTYAEMYAYWPGAETEDVAVGGLRDAPTRAGEAAEINKRMAKKMNSYKKFVFSRGGASEPARLEQRRARRRADRRGRCPVHQRAQDAAGPRHPSRRRRAAGTVARSARTRRRVPPLRASRSIEGRHPIRRHRRQARTGAGRHDCL